MKYKSKTIGMDENPNRINKPNPISSKAILDLFPPASFENLRASNGISETKRIPSKMAAKSTKPVDSLK
jgi:hypothetical protein